ncbi:hypothetical protein [Fictibacillus barbaricus]|uniref:DUF2651 domain-containing protein n=1 Tax=Fictibacillus barbaricus TaxID=182136 RepID=A0ABS2ZIJ9_9BACL|nr:hypothetical protein [Fictibacillus barbaricus]MBN3547975.1 hypothetical protein [Fictibacillus barbaricus]GGB52996.1 hypothetical protein GCM10007199_18600 [Fictibacillus barbaricus]
MEFLLVFTFHFFIMGSLVLLLSGIITFFIKRLHFIFVVLFCMVGGYLYSINFEIPDLAWFAIVFNGILSLLAVGLIKAGLYARQKAEQIIK